MRARVVFSVPVRTGLVLALAGLTADSRAQDALPEAPFRCSVSATDGKAEVAVSIDNPSATGVVSDGVGSLFLSPKDAAGAGTRYVAPINLIKGKAAAVGEDVSLTLAPKETRAVTLSLGALRWARQMPGLRFSLDSLKKVVPAGSYELGLRVGSVTCTPPAGPVSVAP